MASSNIRTTRPTELPSSITIFLQTATSILLTGAFTLFLFHSLRRRRRRRAKETVIRKFEGSKKALNKASNAAIKGKSPPSADEAFLGALIAAAFGVLLYKFTTSVECTLNHQVLSNNYSVRQITIAIRTIINGLCYLATFVFGFNSLGLFLYSGQLALNSFVDVPIDVAPLNSNLPDHSRSSSDDQSSDNTKVSKRKNKR